MARSDKEVGGYFVPKEEKPVVRVNYESRINHPCDFDRDIDSSG
jgi:hypothetical protein